VHLFLKVSRAVLMVSMMLAPFQLPGVAQGKEHPRAHLPATAGAAVDQRRNRQHS